MSELNIGGRGKNAPYKTKSARIPVPLDSQIAEIKKRYLQYLEQGGDVNNPPYYLTDIKPVERFKQNKINLLVDAIESLVDKMDTKLHSYQRNSFSKGFSDIKEIHKISQELKSIL